MPRLPNHLHRECAERAARAGFLTAIEVVRSGRLGELRVFTSLFVEPIPAGDVKLRKGTGPMEYIGVYCLNAARLFADEPEDAFALETASLIRSSRVAGVATFTSMPPTAPTSA